MDDDYDEEIMDSVQENLYKVLVIGEYGVGYFSPNYKLTIGVDFAQKVIDWDESTRINLQLWDVAGHERFGHMTRVYYKYAIAAVIVFDLSRPATFEAVSKWYSDISQKVMLTNEKPIPIILLANK
ncbi:Ras-related protein Rab-32B, partial [Exaiptasia diaphana]